MTHRVPRLALALAASLTLSACAWMEGGTGWQTLLDGNRGLENFDALGGANWRAEADGIVADRRATNDTSNYLASRAVSRDFPLRVGFWVSEDATSGLYVRCT